MLGRVLRRFPVLLAALALFASGAQASVGERSWHATAYVSQWAHENLGNIPHLKARGEIDWWEQYFVGGAASKVLYQKAPIPLPILRQGRIELEGQVLYHFGEMDYPEATLALFWRSPDLNLPGGLSVNAAIGEGFSYTFKDPTLESVRRGRKTQKLLNYLAFELELTHASMPNVHFVPRVHHRSGVFGVIGPRGDGSNYIGAGLRVSFQ